MPGRRRLVLQLLAPLALAALPAQAQRGAQPVVSTTARTTAIVESIDQRARTVLLRREDDSLLSMKIGPEVRNLAQVRAGDRVVIEHTEAVAARLARPGGPSVEAAEAFARRPQGARPGAAVADVVRARVKIEQVFGTGDTVSFTGPAGVRRTLPIRSPEMQAFARSLRPGDEVDVTFIDVVAIRVEPMR